MRSRSSRLFIVLLHLVGVSTNLPVKLWDWSAGIVGVHPVAILLERLELENAGGLDGLLRRLKGAGYDVDGLLNEPYWLQDDADGKCMGPEGFSECGDATLWLVRRRPLSRRGGGGRGRRRNKRGRRKRGSTREARRALSFLLGASGKASWDNDHGDDEDNVGYVYALQLIDVNGRAVAADGIRSSSPSGESMRTRHVWGDGGRSKKITGSAECLVAGTEGRERKKRGRRKKLDDAAGGGGRLQLVPCEFDEAWKWRVDGDGVLVREGEEERNGGIGSGGNGQTERGGADRSVLMGVYRTAERRMQSRNCLRRMGTAAGVASCPLDEYDGSLSIDNDETNKSIATSVSVNKEEELKSSTRPVRFSLIRYQAGGIGGASARLPKFVAVDSEMDVGKGTSDGTTPPSREEQDQKSSSSSLWPSAKQILTTGSGSGLNLAEEMKEEEEEESHLPHSRRASRSQASVPSLRPNLKLSTRLLHNSMGASGTNPSTKTKSASSSSQEGGKRRPFPTGSVAFPQTAGGGGPVQPSLPNRNLLHHPKAAKAGPSSISSTPPSSPPLGKRDGAPHKPRKIPVHPYIAGAKNPGVWEDPQTGLDYLTDLSGYLGHDRKETGRHTLMGVGLYTRTVFNIKVYGCAFYAAKRDVLADPAYAPFAAMTAEQLRMRDDFYDLLMSPPPLKDSGGQGGVDRTLFLKMNMQLSTETMRTSLDADWSLMTPVHKNMLISSSFKQRPANEGMLRKIQSPENSSRCSCGQLAPPEYEADPGCCARGTELVFTWRKNGDIELRLDGRVMDTFPDPDLGRAIFYEYLRGDDPMSMDARNHFVDGYPFLLAPLAQVRGVSSPVRPQEQETRPPEVQDSSLGVFRFVGNFAGAVGSQAAAVAGWIHGGACEAMNNVGRTAKAAGDSARNFGAELERRRSVTWGHVVSLSGQGLNLAASLVPFRKARREDKMIELRVLKSDGSTAGWDNVSNQSLQNILVGPMTQGFGQSVGRGSEDVSSPMTDEIGIIKHPTMNFTHQLFLYTIHLYLMLLLIVSVPGSYTTKLVLKRTGSSSGGSDDDESADSIACASPDVRRGISSSKRMRLRRAELPAQLQLPYLEECMSQDEEKHGHTKPPQLISPDRSSRDDVGPRRDWPASSQEQTTEMKKAFSYFL